jgi:hypothetical protein
MKKHLIWGLILLTGMAYAANETSAIKELEKLSTENNSSEEQYSKSIGEKGYSNQRYGANDRFICESYRGQRQHCNADTNGGVRLVRQIGYNSCQGNWGYDYYGVWVTNGCRGEFQVDRYQQHYGQTTDVLRCESQNYGRQTCARNLQGAEVTMIHQLSNRTCQGNWGYNYNEVWVANGCRADFYVTHTGNNSGYNNGLVECRSFGTNIEHCQVPDLQSVELVQELSNQYNSSCRGNWGYSSHGLWVRGGCHAQFRVVEYQQQQNNPGYPTHQDPIQPPVVRESFTIKCKSRNGALKICDTKGPFYDVEFKREISKGKYPCDGNWGVNKRGELFVTKSCYAEFKVYK